MNEKMRKYVLPNLPYLIFFLVFDRMGQAYRTSDGVNAAYKLLDAVNSIAMIGKNLMPSLYPADLLMGLSGAGALRLMVYVKSKNAKKYRKDTEYGSARWGTKEDIIPFEDPVFKNNVILTQTEFLTMNGRPKNPAYARNKNCLIVGGSGSGKTRFWLKPNLLQMHSSYAVTDPKG